MAGWEWDESFEALERRPGSEVMHRFLGQSALFSDIVR
jgi:hypothetical protein